VTLQGEYGRMDGLSVLGSLNYSDKTRELTVTTGSGSSKTDRTASFRGNGIGDLLVLVKYSILQPTIPRPTGDCSRCRCKSADREFHQGAERITAFD
jgi:hypothetical protein